MPNTFVNLSVPTADGPGTSFVSTALGRPKTLVFSGPVRGRYVVEGSNDGGNTWDILVDDSGRQALFTSQTPGALSFDCVVGQMRVRSVGNAALSTPPTLSLGAPPAIAPSIFGVLDVPPGPSGFGAAFDLGPSAGAFKTIICRGSLPPGSRYSIQGSMDGVRFDEIALFTADQQGAQPAESLCRFLRVQRDAGGASPVIAVGSEGIFEPNQVGTSEMTIAEDEETSTTSPTDEEVLRQYHVPLSLLASINLGLSMAGQSIRRDAEFPRPATFRVRLGGDIDQPDGEEVLTVSDGGLLDGVFSQDSPPFFRPTTPILVKVTGQGGGSAAAVRNFVLVFHAVAP